MSTIVANTTFAYKGTVFTQGVTYDTAVTAVNLANTDVPHLFYATGGTKTAQTSFVFRDTRAGGIDRIVHRGDVMPSNDPGATISTVHVK